MFSNKNTPWDQEFFAMQREIHNWINSQQAAQTPALRPLVVSKIALLQFHVYLSQSVEKLRALAKRKTSVSTAEKSLIHWGMVFCEKAQNFFTAETQLVSRVMWMKLIHARLGGTPDGKNLKLDDEHLLDMAVRKNHLLRTEKYLTDQLIRIKLQKDDLKQRYHEIITQDANMEAAGSMQSRFGNNIFEALRNPTLSNAGKLLKKITKPVVGGALSQTQRFQFEQQVQAQTETIMGRCRSLAIAAARQPDSSKELRQAFRETMREIENLSAQMRSVVGGPNSDLPTIPPKIQRPENSR